MVNHSYVSATVFIRPVIIGKDKVDIRVGNWWTKFIGNFKILCTRVYWSFNKYTEGTDRASVDFRAVCSF